MKLDILKGTTSKIQEVFIQDSSSTIGAGLTGVAFGDITVYYTLNGAAGAATVHTPATMTIGTWASGGFIEKDATNLPGVYQLGVFDAALTGADSVLIMLKGATNMAPVVLEIQLVDYDPYAALATPTNITAGTIANLTNLPSIPANWLTATGIATSAFTAAKFATACLIAAKFGAGAIDAAALNADAVQKIADKLVPKINTAYDDIVFPMVDDTDHITRKTGLTVTVTVIIDDAAPVAGTGTGPAEIGSTGLYQYDASAADMNGTKLTFIFTTVGDADDTEIGIVTSG